MSNLSILDTILQLRDDIKLWVTNNFNVKLGNTDISNIGDGTVTGAINSNKNEITELNDAFDNKVQIGTMPANLQIFYGCVSIPFEAGYERTSFIAFTDSEGTQISFKNVCIAVIPLINNTATPNLKVSVAANLYRDCFQLIYTDIGTENITMPVSYIAFGY